MKRAELQVGGHKVLGLAKFQDFVCRTARSRTLAAVENWPAKVLKTIHGVLDSTFEKTLFNFYLAVNSAKLHVFHPCLCKAMGSVYLTRPVVASWDSTSPAMMAGKTLRGRMSCLCRVDGVP